MHAMQSWHGLLDIPTRRLRSFSKNIPAGIAQRQNLRADMQLKPFQLISRVRGSLSKRPVSRAGYEGENAMKTLTIGRTYDFVQKYRPTKRHKVARERRMTTCTDINYKMLEEREFPVAMVVENHQYFVEGAKTWEEVHDGESDFRIVSDELRTFEGRLFKARRISYGEVVSSEYVSPDTLVEIARENSGYVHVEEAAVLYEEGKSLVVSDDRNERAKTFQDAADNIIIFDNKIWDATSEPMYLILTFGLGHNHGGTGFFIEWFYNENISVENYFRADQREEAIAYFKETALGRGDTESVNDYEPAPNIRVLMPEMVRANPKTDHAKGCRRRGK